MGLLKTGIQAGVAYAAVNKITKTMEATAAAKNNNKTPPHPPCNCPHCPYSEQAVYGAGAGAPGYPQQMQQMPPPPQHSIAPPPAPYGAPPPPHGRSDRADRADPAPPYDPAVDVQAILSSAFEKRGSRR
ncbi:hypothetical protein Q8F55_008309 [Vanrija albida]|uniref:Uncharacterized protein n=1 Tax=Vanrija albida TaxID=181172 RepID=A0ABR3PW06_9TREE